MTPPQEAHLKAIKDEVTRHLDFKYRKGQQEHGGNLWCKANLHKELADELVDLVTYAHCVRANNTEIHNQVVEARTQLSKGAWPEVQTCLDKIYELTL